MAKLEFIASCPPEGQDGSSLITITSLQGDIQSLTPCCNTVVCSKEFCEGAAVFITGPGTGIDEPIIGKNGDLVQVQVQIKEFTQPIDSFGFNISYDPSILSFESSNSGSLVSNFATVECQEVSPGILACDGFNSQAIPASSDGVLFDLFFSSNCVVGDTSLISISDLSEDFLEANAATCENVFICQGCDPSDCDGPSIYVVSQVAT